MNARIYLLILALTVLVPGATANAQAPALSPIVDVTVNADSPVTINVVAIDGGEREIQLVSSLPSFGRLNAPQAAMGELVTSFTLDPAALDVGSYTAALTATAGGMSALKFFRIRVNPAGSPAAPVVSAPAMLEVQAETVFEFPVDVLDPDGGGIVSLGASGLPGGAHFETDATNLTGTLSWTPSIADPGEYDVVFLASSTNGLTAGAVTHLRVTDPPAVRIDPLEDVAVEEGAVATVLVDAVGRSGEQVSVSATLPAFARLDPPDAGAESVHTTISITPPAGSAGTYSASVTATAAGESITESFDIVVVDAGESYACPRGPGFWKAQCAQRSNGSTKFDRGQMDEITGRIDDSSDYFDWEADFDDFSAVVDPPRPMDVRKQTLRMYAVLLANVCTGELGIAPSNGGVVALDPATPIVGESVVDATTIAELIAEVEARLAELEGAVLRSEVAASYQELMNCLEAINEGSAIETNCSADDAESQDHGGLQTAGAHVSDPLRSSVHPNPLNPTTELFFQLSREGRVRVDVYDLQGRLVRRLLDEGRAPGEQRVRWDGSDEQGQTVPSGVYFIRVRTPEAEVTRRATVVK